MSSSASEEQAMTPETVHRWGMAKVFKHPDSGVTVNGMDFDRGGKYLVTTSTDNCVRFYDCIDAKLKKVVECKEFGASCVTFTHHSKCILEACPVDNRIRYHSLHDNAYIRTFEGHSDRITEIRLSQIDDTFMTCSIDRHIRLWDLREPRCIAVVRVDGRPTIACDHEGLIFAIGTGMNQLKLYDKRKYEHGPFQTIDEFPNMEAHKFSPKQGQGQGQGHSHSHRQHQHQHQHNNSNTNTNTSHNPMEGPPPTASLMPEHMPSHQNLMIKGRHKQRFEWCSVQFSPDGKYLLVSTRTNLLYLVDSFEGHILNTFRSYNNMKNLDLYPQFSTDAKYVAIGDCDGDIHFWDINENQDVPDGNTNTNTNTNTNGAGITDGCGISPVHADVDNSECVPISIQGIIHGKRELCVWNGHPRPVQFFKFNPRFLMCASAAQHTAIWLPKEFNAIQSSHPKKSNLRKVSQFESAANNTNSNNNKQVSVS